MKAFQYSARAQRIVFGVGTIRQVGKEIDALGASSVLVLSTPEQRPLAEQVTDLLGDRAIGIFDRAVMHVPVETARAACAMAFELGADSVVAIGGGSTTGLAKAIALEMSLPVLAIPTTYAGSEMTTIYGLTDAGLKRTGTDVKVLPRTVIYDPQLTYSLPVAISVTSGINALAHAAEGLYAHDRSPISDLMAGEGIRAIAAALPMLVSERDPVALREARAQALYGAWLCGAVLGSVGVALHHKLCHTLGGSFNLPHAETHTIVLPHALAYNARAAPGAMASIAQAMGADNAAQGAFDLARTTGAPLGLHQIGMREDELDKACEIALQNQYPNPRPLEAGAIRELLQNAWEGRRPD
ncbi:maleylacetate reductase [Cupriavidus numazuensis]|uniref:Maleylacetate reductase n=1 Tax=Cupriavidus numazuensis TaxID=221992 RepID=A0ABM8TR76_9BURK|nr:maleylacetate reductase [Cupriavidus numazuensis]CAG2158672.1 Maleylacetate reductase [Cupriavidus numazuensis]